MGVRLVKYNRLNPSGVPGGDSNSDHSELFNRDLPDQHPIHAITGLQDILDTLEDNIIDINTKINNILLDIKQIQKDIKNIIDIINNLNIIKDVQDTKTVDLDYNTTTKILKADVKIFNSDDNAIQVKATGLFVDKYPDIETEDTKTIHLYTEGTGETLKTMYQNGNVFSHNGGTNNIASPSEANAWYFDDSLDSFVQPLNTGTFTGFVSNVKYRTYTHRATLRSSDSDNDANGLVIGYILDDAGIPHTLSCIVNKGGESHCGNFYYALVYNRGLSGEQIIKTGVMSSGHSTGGWNNSYITMEVSKAGSAIECSISNWNSFDINLNTIITIDLNDYSWGHYFTSKVQYGYCNQSQANSYFTDIYFNGKGPLKADIILSTDKGNGLEIRDNGLYCSGNSSGSGNQIEITQASHGLIPGDIVYCDTNGLFQKALAEDSIKLEALGVVSSVIDANTFIITLSGLINGLGAGFSNGDVLYLSQTTAGTFSISQELTILKPIGIKIPNGVLINIQRATYLTKYLPDDTSSLVTYTH